MNQSAFVFAVRHGQTAWNAEQRVQGQLDVPLDDVGRWQAEQVAAALADDGLDAIVSSDLERAFATAAALARATGAPHKVDAGLRERHFGRFQGLTHSEIEARWPEEALRWRQRESGFAPGGGETPEAFFERSLACATRLAAAHAGQRIALVSHGGVLDCLYRAAVGVALDAPRTWKLDNATINRLLWSGERFALVGWNDHAHLEAGPPPAAPSDSA